MNRSQKNIEVSSLGEYSEVIAALYADLKQEDFPRRLYFRGQDSVAYELIPSLARQLSGYNNLESGLERRIVEYVIERFPEAFAEVRTPIDRLAFLQHHGAPTRLLDITSSSLVALYFAVAGKCNADGEVFVFKAYDSETERYPIDMAIADSYRMMHGSVDSLSSFYALIKMQDYFMEQRDIIGSFKSNEEGGHWIRECCERPLFVHSYHHSVRQKIQQASFILFPNDIQTGEDGYGYFIERISPLPKDHEVIAAKLVIPAEAKLGLIKELEYAGISRSILFADSIDVTCQEAGKYAVRKSMDYCNHPGRY